jgi:hypothetical protein
MLKTARSEVQFCARTGQQKKKELTIPYQCDLNFSFSEHELAWFVSRDENVTSFHVSQVDAKHKFMHFCYAKRLGLRQNGHRFFLVPLFPKPKDNIFDQQIIQILLVFIISQDLFLN